MDRAPPHTDRCVTIEKNTPVQPSTVPTRRRGAWSSATRGVVAAGGALAVALLATACTQASAAVPEEPSAVPSAAQDAVSQPAEAAPQKSDEDEPSPVPAAPDESAPSDQRAATPVPAAPSETRPSDEGEPRPVPTVPAERAEEGLAVTG